MMAGWGFQGLGERVAGVVKPGKAWFLGVNGGRLAIPPQPSEHLLWTKYSWAR